MSPQSELSQDILKDRDYFLIIDTSGSMATDDCPNKSTRLQFAKETTLAFVHKIIPFDPDGITLITFSTRHQIVDNVKSKTQIEQIFSREPNGNTKLALPLEYVFKRYLEEKQQKKTKPQGAYIVVVTDGAADDKEAVKQAITGFSQKLDTQTEIGILFLQIANDPSAKQFLDELDVALKPPKGTAKFDIVAVSTIEDVNSISKALVSAFTPNS